MTSRIEGPERVKGLQRIRMLSGYLDDTQAEFLREAYRKVENDPKILIDLSKVEDINSHAMNTLVRIFHAKPNESQKVYLILPELIKDIYFDPEDRPWAVDYVFIKEEDIPGD